MPKAVTEVDREMGARVRSRRIELGLTQGALASALGVSFQQVQKYEKGKDRIKASALATLAQTLKMTIGDLYGATARLGFAETDQAPFGPGAPVGDPMLAAEAMRLNRAFLQIADPVLRRAVVELAIRLAESGAAKSRSD
ncbi:MAG: helix-turn-helix transcriptional regulator [Methylobacteriaceae bacterium]|nr:helix-turn-helix transcriptional regulator [Methylobacteriaceae bacterium]